jgi:DNA-binding SARP family transcriptional activator
MVLVPGHVAEAAPLGSNGQGSAPTDGRLRGQDFSATVTDVAWPATLSSPSGTTYVAGTNRRLVAFALSVTQASADAGLENAPTGVSAALTIGSTTLPVSMSTIDRQIAGGSRGSSPTTGTDSFVASVPARVQDVSLTLSEGGFSQSLDLWTLKRTPPSPTVLYRDPTSSTVSGTVAGPFHVNFTNPADGFSSSNDVQVKSATLTYFAPGSSGSTPGNPAQAFLVLDLQSSYPSVPYGQPDWGHFFSSFTPLPGNQLTFTPDGAGAIPATADTADFSSTQAANDDDGLFDAVYSLAVPATTTGGTLNVVPGTASGMEFTGFTGSGTTVPITVTGPASVALSFPAVPAGPANQKQPPWVDAPLPTTGLVAAGTATGDPAGPHGSSGGTGIPLWAGLLALVVAVALGVGLDQARRRHRAAVATTAGDVVAADTSVQPVAGPVPADAAAPSSRDDERFRFDCIGPPRARGWSEEPESELLREMAGFLALQERAVTLDDVSLALWPIGGTRDAPSRETLHTYMSRLRKALGHDRLPDATAGRGYRITDAETDWGIFQELVARAEGAAETEAMTLRRQALSLVRGVPFASIRPGQYGWALESGLVDHMTVAIVRCAHVLAGQYGASGEVEEARAALEAGLLASPAEEQLFADLWHLAATKGDSSEQRRARARIVPALGTEAAERICGP